jgi:hypothetical protein
MALIVFEIEGDSVFALGYPLGLAEDADCCLVVDRRIGCGFACGVEFDTPIVEALGLADIQFAAWDKNGGEAADYEVHGETTRENAENPEGGAGASADRLDASDGESDDGGEKTEDKKKLEDHPVSAQVE